MEILSGDPRFVPVLVATPYGRDDVLWGLVDRWLDDQHALVTVRDVGFFADTVTYGDVIEVVAEENGLRLVRVVEPSQWNAFVAILATESSDIERRFKAYPPVAHLAGKISPSPIGPILAVAIASAWASKLCGDLDNLYKQGVLRKVTWSVVRMQEAT